ncbi:hypothetical protein A9404_11750 [Halothiobacillus diazotrophicus]|uniref:Lipoprotein n=1 Tax=Halothiobacillus diazotrophicus TaxID=1860122 RepID=A0A191ZJ96_9GAMM|nr:hypothetical protein [Halothiobacillus diazotrophicus]ANJ67959.1 hypothetical protein A9404_11750 [Halothiobacillus diazotrophicus]
MNNRRNRLDRWLAAGALIAALVTLGGCASVPQYATQTTYRPPATAAGQACIATCHTKLQQCQTQCAAEREACISNIEPIAKQAFEDDLKRYEAARKQYESDRQIYELNQAFRSGWSYPVFVPRYGWVMGPGWYGPGWFGPNDDPPTPPPAPSLKAERDRLIKERCDSKPCPCQNNFEQCYIGCGGQVEKSVVCIANCGDKDPRPQMSPMSSPVGNGNASQTLTPLPATKPAAP